MSKTYTSGSYALRTTRGGGRSNGGTRQMEAHTRSNYSNGASAPPAQNADVAERMQRRDAYTVIAPNEEKRRSVQQMAEREERNYEAYRERIRPQHLSYVGTVGGAESNTAGTSLPQRYGVQPARQLTTQQKCQQYRQDKKRREEADLEQMRQQQRQKSIDNELREMQRQEQLDADRKQKMAAFLDSVEAKSKKSAAYKQ